MCSILALLGLDPDRDDLPALRKQALRRSALLRHRGPDWSGVYDGERAILVHERLAIVDPESGAQPLRDTADELVLGVNGEIYNHRQLQAGLAEPYAFATRSDCEVLLPLFRAHGGSDAGLARMLESINGIFAFVLHDRRDGGFLIARDPIGVIPLFTGRDPGGRLWVASELKALVGVCERIEVFPPGHFLTHRHDAPVPYYRPAWREYAHVQGVPADGPALREALSQAVHRQLMSDVPYGVLLSGGLDSSLVAAIAARFAEHRVEDDDHSAAWWPRLHSFAIGLEGSPDLAAARTVADRIGSVHHGIVYTIQEGLDALPDVIRHIESFDVTTVRASTPMFLLARRIKAMGVKMVLSGEGADEIFGGYLYFHKAPDAAEFHAETVRKLDALHQYDCLRANKSMAAWGVEARVPFLDREFLDVAMGFDAVHKLAGPDRMEKHVLRAAFEGSLPHAILWRQKEQFSDGVGYGWIDALRDHAEAEVSDADLAAASERFALNPPTTKEAYLYRSLFAQAFPGDGAASCVAAGPSIACSTPTALRWDASFADTADPSGRAIRDVHRDGYQDRAQD